MTTMLQTIRLIITIRTRKQYILFFITASIILSLSTISAESIDASIPPTNAFSIISIINGQNILSSSYQDIVYLISSDDSILFAAIDGNSSNEINDVINFTLNTPTTEVLGGILAQSCIAGQVMTGIGSNGIIFCTTPEMVGFIGPDVSIPDTNSTNTDTRPRSNQTKLCPLCIDNDHRRLIPIDHDNSTNTDIRPSSNQTKSCEDCNVYITDVSIPDTNSTVTDTRPRSNQTNPCIGCGFIPDIEKFLPIDNADNSTDDKPPVIIIIPSPPEH